VRPGRARLVTEGALSDTKQRILDAAERLFATEGFDGTSMRSVTAAAGANLAAVNYHFGSKAALFEAVVARIFGPVNARQLDLLDALEAGPGEPSVEELLEAFMSPLADLFDSGRRGPVLARLFGRVMGDPGEEMQRMVLEQVRETDRRYRAAFARALPHFFSGELWWRVQSTISTVVSHQVHSARMPAVAELLDVPPGAAGAGKADRLAWMTTFLAGGLTAPATAAERSEGREDALAGASPVRASGAV
jgi:AcrR family transcriptional regulator